MEYWKENCEDELQARNTGVPILNSICYIHNLKFPDKTVATELQLKKLINTI